MRLVSRTWPVVRAIALSFLLISFMAGPVVAAAGDVFTDTAVIGGAITEIVVSGDYAYAIVGGSVIVVNIGNRASPALVGRVEVSEARLNSLAAAGTMVYVTDLEHLYVVNAANPANPQVVATHSSVWVGKVAAGNGYVVLGTLNKLQVLDLSTPQTLTVLGEVTAPSGLGVTMIEDALLNGSMVYLPTGTSGFPYHGLWMVSIANPASPQSQGFYALSEEDPVVGVNAGYAHIADGADVQSDVRIVNVSNPAAPSQVSTYSPTFVADEWRWELPDSYVTGFAFSGSTAFVAATTTSLNVVDVANPASPQVGGWLDLSDDVLAVAASGTDVFLGGHVGGLVSVDASVGTNPVIQGLAPLPATPWIGSSLGHAYLSERGVHIYDVLDPSDPQLVGYDGRWDSLLAVGGRYAYALEAAQTLPPDGSPRDLVVLDLQDPAAPQEVGSYTTPNYLFWAAPTGSLIVLEEVSGLSWLPVTGYSIAAKLRLLDVSDPTLPQLRGSVDMNWQLTTPHYMADTAIVGDAVLICGADLRVVDIGDPDHPAISYTDPGSCYSLATDGTYAYVTRPNGGLFVLDVSDPASPVTVASTNISAQVAVQKPNMEIIGPYLLNESAQPRNLHVMDLSDFAAPVDLGLFALPDDLATSAVVGNDYYATLDAMGTHVVALSGAPDTLSCFGQVLSEEGLPIAGVVVRAGDTVSTTTDAAGVYRFVDLPEDTYLVYPEDSGVSSWSPPFRQLSGDASWQNFTASTASTTLVKSAMPPAGEVMSFGDIITYTILSSAGSSGVFTDAVPTYTTYIPGSLIAPAWIAYDSALEAITGTIPLAGTQLYSVSFSVRVAIAGSAAFAPEIRNAACLAVTGDDCTWSNAVTHPTFRWATYLPLVIRGG